MANSSHSKLAKIDNENFNTSMLILELYIHHLQQIHFKILIWCMLLCCAQEQDEFDVTLSIKYVNSKGKEFNNSARDILFQIINHSTYHRAQAATEFRQCGLEPLMTDYIFYKI